MKIYVDSCNIEITVRMFAVSVAILTTFLSAASVPNGHDTIPAHKGLGLLNLYDGKKVRGFLIDASDSTITLVKKKDWNSGFYQLKNTIEVSDIIDVQKRTRSRRSMLGGFGIGALTGTVMGALIALVDCDDPDNPCNFWEQLLSAKSLRASIALTASFGAIGAVIGLASFKKRGKRFVIDRSRENLGRQKLEILYY